MMTSSLKSMSPRLSHLPVLQQLYANARTRSQSEPPEVVEVEVEVDSEPEQTDNRPREEDGEQDVHQEPVPIDGGI